MNAFRFTKKGSRKGFVTSRIVVEHLHQHEFSKRRQVFEGALHTKSVFNLMEEKHGVFSFKMYANVIRNV